MPPATAPRRHGGIRKHQQQQRRDRDGDIVMGAAPRSGTSSAPRNADGTKGPRPARPAPRNNAENGHDPARPANSLAEVKVTGWTESSEIGKLINFLERHSARRSQKATRGGVHPKMIKRHEVSGSVLRLFVRTDDVTPFGKINGFTFTSSAGSQKLRITGPGIRTKSSNESPPPTTALQSADTSTTTNSQHTDTMAATPAAAPAQAQAQAALAPTQSVPAPVAAVAPEAAPLSAQPSFPGFTQEQEAMITYVIEATRLKRELAIQCLEAGAWNIETAAQLFNAQKDNLPADAFM